MGAVACCRAAEAWPLDAERCRLVESHIGLAETIARKRCLRGHEDPDDTRSDAFWGLLLAVRAFDAERGSFAAYAAVRIEYAIRRGRQIRSGVPRLAWERGDRRPPLSLQGPAGEDGTELVDLLTAPPDAEESSLVDALRLLPARERLVLGLRYFRGLKQSEVARIIGCSQMQVSRIERAGIEKLRDSASQDSAALEGGQASPAPTARTNKLTAVA